MGDPRQSFNLPQLSQWPFGLSCGGSPALRRWESGDHHHRVQLPSHVLDSTSASWRNAGRLGRWVLGLSSCFFLCQKITWLLTNLKAIGPPQCHWMQHATRRPLGVWHYLWNWAEEPFPGDWPIHSYCESWKMHKELFDVVWTFFIFFLSSHGLKNLPQHRSGTRWALKIFAVCCVYFGIF